MILAKLCSTLLKTLFRATLCRPWALEVNCWAVYILELQILSLQWHCPRRTKQEEVAKTTRDSMSNELLSIDAGSDFHTTAMPHNCLNYEHVGYVFTCSRSTAQSGGGCSKMRTQDRSIEKPITIKPDPRRLRIEIRSPDMSSAFLELLWRERTAGTVRDIQSFRALLFYSKAQGCPKTLSGNSFWVISSTSPKLTHTPGQLSRAPWAIAETDETVQQIVAILKA